MREVHLFKDSGSIDVRRLFGALVSLSGTFFFLIHAPAPEQHAARTLPLRLDLVRVRVQCARLCHVTHAYVFCFLIDVRLVSDILCF